MRATVARALRRLVYAGDLSPRHRRHYRHPHTGACQADDLRRRYQAYKTIWRHTPWTQKTPT
jgi:hypothetical protein